MAAVATALPSTAGASHVPGAPVNDDYLDSLQLNAPGSRLERGHTLSDVRDATKASVQSDVFSPPQSGGPAELTSCAGSSYGKTIWYDFFPDASGQVQLRANGPNAVITVVQFDVATAVPDFGSSVCRNASAGPNEALTMDVEADQAYTVQVGSAGAGGNVEFLFDFLPALRLRVVAASKQRLRRPRRGDRYNNLVHRARCSVDCSLRFRGYASYRRRGRLIRLRGSGIRGRDNLAAGRTDSFGVRFSSSGRRRLIRSMSRYGALRWTLKFRAVADDGRSVSVTKRIRMLPPRGLRPRSPSRQRAPSPPRRQCDSSYPTVCIPPYPPDLDCDDIPDQDFRVSGSDPHGFDREGDGIGCES